MPGVPAAATETAKAAGGGSSHDQHKRTDSQTHEHLHLHRSSVWDPLRKIGSWLRRDEERGDNGEGGSNRRGRGESGGGSGGGGGGPLQHQKQTHEHGQEKQDKDKDKEQQQQQEKQLSGLLHRRSSRRAVPGLPRPLTFKRMNSEKRDRLVPVEETSSSAGTGSGARPRATSRPAAPSRALSPPPLAAPSVSAPNVLRLSDSDARQHPKPAPTIGGAYDSNIPAGARQVDYEELGPDEDRRAPALSPRAERLRPPSIAGGSYYAPSRLSQRSASFDEARLQEELEAKWILNLSMHFRDRSDREKFFITYAEEPTHWRRVTVSCDYRDLTPDSLEADLKSLHYQRDKSARIYEAIRDSLPAIQFYPTVTNLKLQTADGRLHVHVTEDVNEIIPYPSLSSVSHLGRIKQFKESAVSFDSHISGFVYKVRVHDRVYIKKEIPGPDAVEEFLYEINALCALQESHSVIRFEGVIVDEASDLIKGLLISYAEQGALVDIIYDVRNSEYLSWERRERWARQIVQGLSEIHEAGFVQGDFTLSNIVVDRDENAKIIDINRRGCPVGWEPPELAQLIESGQRISIYIGVKSDLFQLGMVLWALAEQQDEPERQERPLYEYYENRHGIPAYYRDIVEACLSDQPRNRPSAKALLNRFPSHTFARSENESPSTFRLNVSVHRPNGNKEYIDPATAVDLEDISNSMSKHSGSPQRPRSRSPFSSIQMPSTEYVNSSGSYIVPHSHSHSHYHPRRYPYRRNSRDSDTSTRRTNSHSQLLRSEYSSYPANTNRAHSTLSLDDSELDNELASLPASRGTRWEQVYVDGDTKLVQRGGIDCDIETATHSFEKKDVVCITTPPPMGSHDEDENERERDGFHGEEPVNEEKKYGTPPTLHSTFTPSKDDDKDIFEMASSPRKTSSQASAAIPHPRIENPSIDAPAAVEKHVTPPMQHSPFPPDLSGFGSSPRRHKQPAIPRTPPSQQSPFSSNKEISEACASSRKQPSTQGTPPMQRSPRATEKSETISSLRTQPTTRGPPPMQRSPGATEKSETSSSPRKQPITHRTPPMQQSSFSPNQSTSDPVPRSSPRQYKQASRIGTPPPPQSPFTTANSSSNSSPRTYKQPSSKASFSERIRRATPTEEGRPSITSINSLADLEHEVATDIDTSGTSTVVPSRTGTGFSEFFRPPMHQDSGFYEPERISFENEKIRQSLDANRMDLACVVEEREVVIEGRLWDEGDGTMWADPAEAPISNQEAALNMHVHVHEEKERSNATITTIRPPSLIIPHFHHHKVAEAGYDVYHKAQQPEPASVHPNLRHVYGHISSDDEPRL